MQDRYTGDVGDFGKYGLLRKLRGDDDTALRLGVIWYRPNPATVKGDSPNDGKHISYLNDDQRHRYRPSDPVLYDELRHIVVCRGDRRVQAIEQSRLLGVDTVWFSDYVPGPAEASSKQARIAPRTSWAAEARRATENCDLVFLDPDNGLEVKSAPKSRKKAPKYVYLDEVEALLGRGQSLVIYHHLGRHKSQGSHAEQVARWCKRLRQQFEPGDVFGLRFSRGTGRAYFVIATPAHAEILADRVVGLGDSAWGEHFELMS